MGLIAGLSATQHIRGEPFVLPPKETAIGALLQYLTQKKPGRFQPMNINFGLFPLDETRIPDKKIRNQKIIERAFSAQCGWMKSLDFTSAS